MKLRTYLLLAALGLVGCVSHPAPFSQTPAVFEQLVGKWDDVHPSISIL